MELVLNALAATSARATLGESPLWTRAGKLHWLDVIGRRLFTLTDGHETSAALPTTVTAIELGPEHLLLAVTSTGLGWLDPDTGDLEERVRILADDNISMNDCAIDRSGRCWAGSAVRDQSQRGALYRLDENGVTAQLHGLGMSNGIDWSPSDEVMYHVDSAAGTLKAWEYEHSSGQLGGYRVLRSISTDEGLPDGLTVDSEGNVWLAIWGAGQVWRIDPSSGETTAIVEVPTPYTTSCAFGGPELSTLYVTSADHDNAPGGGLLYAVETPVRGLHPHRAMDQCK